MASSAADGRMATGRPEAERSVVSLAMLLAAWLPAAIVTVLHYLPLTHEDAFHFVLRRLYYLPILFAAFTCGMRGGLLLAAAVAVAYIPHAFGSVGHADPAHSLEKSLELLLYVIVGGVAGVLVDRERERQRQLTATAEELRRALEEQRLTADQLVRAGRLAALGELVAGIAHEIKNPLHALRGTAEVVDEVVPADVPQRRIWTLHVKELDRLQTVAERFLSFARPTPPQRKPAQLQQLVERTHELIRSQAHQHAVQLEVHPPRPPLAPIAVDEQQIVQVLLNISLNALQALGDETGTITYRLTRARRGDHHYQVIDVANDGPPIPDELLERIFDPFTTTKSDGSGLGLSVASRIVEQHDGFLEVRNQTPARGVRFSLFLPD